MKMAWNRYLSASWRVVMCVILASIGFSCVGPKTANDWVEKGADYEKSGQYSKAIEAYTHAIELQPNDAKLYFYRAMAWGLARNYPKGIGDFSQAIHLDSENPFYYYSRAVAYHTIGDLNKALADAQKANTLSSGGYEDFVSELTNEIRKKTAPGLTPSLGPERND